MKFEKQIESKNVWSKKTLENIWVRQILGGKFFGDFFFFSKTCSVPQSINTPLGNDTLRNGMEQDYIKDFFFKLTHFDT